MPVESHSPAVHGLPVKRAYDVCVLGSSLGGVAVGALLARRGHRVLHVDPDGRGTGFADGGWRIPWGPALVPALRGLPAADAVLGELGLSSDARHLEPSRPALQLLLPRHRLDLPSNPAERDAELRREWPDDAPRLASALAAIRTAFEAAQPFLAGAPPLPPRGMGQRWRSWRSDGRAAAAGVADPLRTLGDHPLAAALRAASPFLSSLGGPPSPLGLARTIGAVLQGTLHAAGGEAALAALLRRRIGETRGELLGGPGEPVPVGSIEFSGGRVVALRVTRGDARYAARAFVLAGDPTSALPLLGPAAGARLQRWLEPATPAGGIVSLSWVVRASALPPPLGDVALTLPTSGPAALLQVLPAVRAGAGGDEPSPLERVLVAGTPLQGPDETVEAAEARLRETVAATLPFLDRATLHVASPRERGVPFRPLLPARADRLLGVGGASVVSPVPNLFLAGPEVLPGLGTEGQFQAAWQAAEAVEKFLGARARPK